VNEQESASIDLFLKDTSFSGKETTIKRFIKKVLLFLGLASWDLSVIFLDADSMRMLNLQYRGENESTDVLSFSQLSQPKLPAMQKQVLGDIAIDGNRVHNQAQLLDIDEDEELYRCLVHGILHLAGMTHPEGWASEMIMIQEWIISRRMSLLYL